MGIFTPNFEKEGHGIEKDAPSKTGLSLFIEIYVRELWNLMKVNLLFLIYCIPIVTIGPALGALSSITMKMVQEKHCFIFSDFNEEFKKNWKQSFISTIITSLAFVLIIWPLYFYFTLANDNKNALIYFLFMITFSLLLFAHITFIYIFPLISTAYLSVKDIFKNSFLLAMSQIKSSLTTAVISILLIFFNFFFLPYTVPIFILLLFSTISFIFSFTAWPGIKNNIIKESLV